MERIYRNDRELKHRYAYNEYNHVVYVDEAKKDLNGKPLRYFMYPDQECEMILRAENSSLVTKHFALKTFVIERNGNKYRMDAEHESVEHNTLKLQIAKNAYFQWAGYKILIQNPKLEFRYQKSLFRSDLVAELLSGEKIHIEIVKTSDVSNVKHNYITENQLLTFKIYIDNEGNTIDTRSDFLGNKEVESIRERYREKLSEYQESERVRKRFAESNNSRCFDLRRRIDADKETIKIVASCFDEIMPMCDIKWYRPHWNDAKVTRDEFYYYCT